MIEYRGVWDPGGLTDSPGIPPAMTEPAQHYWGFFLTTGYDIVNPLHIEPSGAEVALVEWEYGWGVPRARGDWSQPGFLWSYVDTDFVPHPQPGPRTQPYGGPES